MLQNAYFLAKIGADTAENERNFAENLPKSGNYPTGARRGERALPLEDLSLPGPSLLDEHQGIVEVRAPARR